MRSCHASYAGHLDKRELLPPEFIIPCTFLSGDTTPITSRRVRPITKRTPKLDGDRQHKI